MDERVESPPGMAIGQCTLISAGEQVTMGSQTIPQTWMNFQCLSQTS